MEQEEMKDSVAEEGMLKKRDLLKQDEREMNQKKRQVTREKTTAPTPNKYFNKEQYYNVEYEEIRKEKRSEKKERDSITKKEKKQQEKPPN